MEEENRVRRAAPWITRRLRVGLAWLWENRRQRKGALIQQSGIHSSAGECDLCIIPEPYKDTPMVVLEGTYRFPLPRLPVGRPAVLTTEEMESFTRLLERAAWEVGKATVLEIWGGAGKATASFRLSRRCGKGATRLLETHRKGCPVPGHPLLCVWDGCSWFTDGYEKARLPKGWR